MEMVNLSPQCCVRDGIRKGIVVGIASRAPVEWVREFQAACETLRVKHTLVEISRNDWMEKMQGVDILMWRIHLGDHGGLIEAAVKIPIAEAMGKLCFPSSKMAGLYENKIAQAFLFKHCGYPTPDTFVSFSRDDALAFTLQATYPLVFKTTGGAGSSGVAIVRDQAGAKRAVRSAFRESPVVWHYLRAALGKLFPRGGVRVSKLLERFHSQAQYVIFQEYIQAAGDLRVAVLGKDLAAVFWRKNRPNDFRASGSGLLEAFTEETLPVEPCNTAFEICRQQGFTSMAFDFLPSPRGWVITEMSYTFLLKHEPWDYTDALFRQMPNGKFKREPKTAIGVMHVRAMLDAFNDRGSKAAQARVATI